MPEKISHIMGSVKPRTQVINHSQTAGHPGRRPTRSVLQPRTVSLMARTSSRMRGLPRDGNSHSASLASSTNSSSSKAGTTGTPGHSVSNEFVVKRAPLGSGEAGTTVGAVEKSKSIIPFKTKPWHIRPSLQSHKRTRPASGLRNDTRSAREHK